MAADLKLLERVQKLIALSASDREEEARTSAFIACKLIREHKLTVGTGPYVSARQPPFPRKPAWHRPEEEESEPDFRRSSVPFDTSILTSKQFTTAIQQAWAYSRHQAKAQQFFSSQEVEARKGSRVAQMYLKILDHVLAQKEKT